jgi:type VI secretion system protein VasD
MRRLTTCLVAAATVIAVSGCAATLGAFGLASPRHVPEAEKPPRAIDLRLHAAAGLNGGNGGPPLALVARVYTLRRAETFERMPYAAFTNAHTEKEMLGSDLLDVREVLLIPGQRHEVREKVTREAGFIGVVALFRAPDGQRWRAAFPAADAEKGGITVGLHGCAMTVSDGTPARQRQLTRPLSEAHCG